MNRMAFLAVVRLLCAASVLFAPLAGQDPGPRPPRAEIGIKSSDQDLALTGRTRLKIDVRVQEPASTPFAIRLEVRLADRLLLRRDHLPPRPADTWRKGEILSYEIPVAIPAWALGAKGEAEVWVGFRGPKSGRLFPPTGVLAEKGLGLVGWISLPETAPPDNEESLAALLAAAKTLVKEGHGASAWAALTVGYRRTENESGKRRILQALEALPSVAPRALDLVEDAIVRRRIEAERRRFLRREAGRLNDRGLLHGALRILEAIGGSLAEDGRKAVLGSLASATRNLEDRQDIQRKILKRISEAARREAAVLLKKVKSPDALMKRTRDWLAKRRYEAARAVLLELRFSDDEDLRNRSYRLLAELDKAWLADTPTKDAAAVEAAVHHPAWGRTIHRESQEFVFIGPRTLVEGIPADSLRRFDLAYLVLTDLFGRRPNPDGDRVTVYFKELWDFGGGVGGGKTIDIGRAKPNAKKLRVDNGLLFHELTHCVDDTNPIVAGFREGLANFGAAVCFDQLGPKRAFDRARAASAKAFRADYLDRDLEYWRIPNYAPSAGFFLHFLRYAPRVSGRLDWSPYRKFFRTYRRSPMKDGREPYIIRALGFHLAQAFGPDVWKDLRAFRFPLTESSPQIIAEEMKSWRLGEFSGFEDEDAFGRDATSPLPRGLVFADLLEDMKRRGVGDAEIRERSFADAGLLHAWHVIGPFKVKGADPWKVVFPPERDPDFGKSYLGEGNRMRWTVPNPDRPPVQIDPLGRILFQYPYQDDSALYALTHITLPKSTEVAFHVRADDHVSLFVDDVLLGQYRNRGRAGGQPRWWQADRAFAPDAMVWTAKLAAGRHRVLVKVRNDRGKAGLVVAATHLDGRPIPGLAEDDGPADTPYARVTVKHWKRFFLHTFSSKSFSSKFDVKVGKFRVRRKALQGEEKAKKVAWRKYTVRPGFPKDSPSNLIWLAKKVTKKLKDFRLTMDLESQGRPKIGITFQGEGKNDGLSGWTVILHPAGKGLGARLERYDRLVYQAPSLDVQADDGVYKLELEVAGGQCTLKVNGTLLLDACSIRTIPRSRLGFMTWGPSLRISRVEIARPR